MVGLEGELQRTIGMLRDEWVELAKRIKEIDRLLVEQAKDDPLDAVYRSVPGVGALIRLLESEGSPIHPGRLSPPYETAWPACLPLPTYPREQGL